MSGLEDFETEEYFDQVIVQAISNKKPHRTLKCENCRTSKVKCQFHDPLQACSKCKARHLTCGPKIFPAPDSESNRMKKWKQFLGKAIPVLLEIFENAEDPEDIVNSLKALSKRLDLSSEITSSSSSIFPSVEQASPAYPQTMSDPAFPFAFANNSTKTSMPQFTPHVPGADHYTVSTTPCPPSAQASGNFSHPIVPVPSFDPSQSSFSSNAAQQYQYPSPPTYNPFQQYQSMQYRNPSGYENQSMSD